MNETKSGWLLMTLLPAILAASATISDAAVITDDFSSTSPAWQFVNYPANATIGISGGRMVADFLGIPQYGGIAPGIVGAIYGNPTFMPDTLEMTGVLEIDGDSTYLYGGLLGRGSADLGYDGTSITGQGYVLTISGYKGNGDLQINRIADGKQTMLEIVSFDGLGSLIDNNPLYMKLTIETIVGGDVRIKGLISTYSDFTSPFGQVEAIDADPSKIVGPGLVGFIAMNDEGEPCLPATVYFDDLYAADFIDMSLPGDCNGDGFVNSADLDIVRGNWGQSASGPADGDLSGDGVVNSADLDIIRGNWGATASAAVVPEPATLALLALSGLLVACGRR